MNDDWEDLPGSAELDRLLAAAAAPGRPDELRGEDDAVAVFRAAGAAPDTLPAPERSGRRRPALAGLLTAKVIALACAVVSIGGVAVAGGTGNLPGQESPVWPAPGPSRHGETPRLSTPSPSRPSGRTHTSHPPPGHQQGQGRQHTGKPKKPKQNKKRPSLHPPRMNVPDHGNGRGPQGFPGYGHGNGNGRGPRDNAAHGRPWSGLPNPARP